jgi:hypothetical protein
MTLPPRTAQETERCDDESGASHSNLCTGPRTPEGKAISAQNATKHGCRSKTLILRDEDPAEYEALHKSWWDQYQPSGHTQETLVQQLIDNHWFLLRATKRVERVEEEMPENPSDWTDAHQRLLTNFMRYKITAERAFQKSHRVFETYLRDCARAEIEALKADLMRAKIEAQMAPKESQPARKFTPLAEIYANMEKAVSERPSGTPRMHSRPWITSSTSSRKPIHSSGLPPASGYRP